MITLKQLGKIIHHRRKKAKITQQELCERLGISQGTLSKVERGKLELGFRPFLEVCWILNVHPNDIFFNEWKQFKKEMENE